jgi:aspartyl-tRNA(Asn)/glutamyl-tRNA(Gln) amidotransferase subunit A
LGTYALSADAFDNYFLQAQKVRQLIKDDFDRVFSIPNYISGSLIRPTNDADSSACVDVLIHPSAIRTAPLLTESNKSDLSSYVQDVLTVPASLAGLPALSIPAEQPRGRPVKKDGGMLRRWPIGVSVVGQWGTDSVVMAVGKALVALQEQERESV